MDYFKINYNKLKNIKEIKFYKGIFILIIIVILLLIISIKLDVYEKLECYGIYQNNLITLEVNTKFSDNIKNSEYIIFNDKKTDFQIKEYGEYEIINNEVYQKIILIVDEKFYDNEVGVIKLYYDKKSVLKYILKLFS